jgi:hypothetical protein
MSNPSAHEEGADLHTLELADGVHVHPHTEAGYLFLLGNLGEDAMMLYDLDIEQPKIALDRLGHLARAATAVGLTIQHQRHIELGKN